MRRPLQEEALTASALQDKALRDEAVVLNRLVDGDGAADLVVANSGANDVSVLLNATPAAAPAASFAPALNFAVGASPQAIVLGDIDGDGRFDIATANAGGSSVSILLNTTTF